MSDFSCRAKERKMRPPGFCRIFSIPNPCRCLIFKELFKTDTFSFFYFSGNLSKQLKQEAELKWADKTKNVEGGLLIKRGFSRALLVTPTTTTKKKDSNWNEQLGVFLIQEYEYWHRTCYKTFFVPTTYCEMFSVNEILSSSFAFILGVCVCLSTTLEQCHFLKAAISLEFGHLFLTF